MKIRVIGCGTAFSFDNFNQSYLLEENGRKMVIDFGWNIPIALKYHNIDIKTINDVYISHTHSDHIGGLEYLAFSRYDWVNKPLHYSGYSQDHQAPRLIANNQLLDELWNDSLKGGLESMEGFVASMDTFFELLPIAPNETFDWEGWECKLVQQIHIMTGSSIKNSFGLIIKKKGCQTIYFTTDSQHCSPRQIEVFYKESDVIFQDCELLPIELASGVHANYYQLSGDPKANSIILDRDIRKKMWLSHYQDFKLESKDFYGNYCDWDTKAEEDGFAGFLHLGQQFEF